MRRMRSRAIVFLLSSAAFAAQPVATITSQEPFELRGVSVPVNGVSNWPIAIGDVIGALRSPAEIRFRDGSRVTLAPGSQAVLQRSGKNVALRLQRGAAAYNLAGNSSLVLLEGNTALKPSRSSGVFGDVLLRTRVAPASDPPPLEPVSGSQPPTSPPAPPPPPRGSPPPPSAPPPKK